MTTTSSILWIFLLISVSNQVLGFASPKLSPAFGFLTTAPPQGRLQYVVRHPTHLQAQKLKQEQQFGQVVGKNVEIQSTNIKSVDECIGSGSFGTVHLLTMENGIQVVGKRCWTKNELETRLKTKKKKSSEELKDKAKRCEEYWKIEQHCFQKLSASSNNIYFPRYLGSKSDAENRQWLLFEPLQSAIAAAAAAVDLPNSQNDDNSNQNEASPTKSDAIVLSLAELMERDLADHKLHSEHHLYYTAQALGLDHHSADDDDNNNYSDNSENLGDTLDFVMTQLLVMMETMHAQKIVHRDIKPSNLLVTKGHDENDDKKHDDTNNNHRLVLIDFGSAADLSTAGLLKANIGLSETQVAVSPIYSAPEIFVDSTNPYAAMTFDVFSSALLYCQLLFQYLDERTESGFHQQLKDCDFNLDAWLQATLQSKVQPAYLQDALDVLEQRPGLWKLLQQMLEADPKQRITSQDAMARWKKIQQNANKIKEDDGNGVISFEAMFLENLNIDQIPREFNDGVFLLEVLKSRQYCQLQPTVWPLHYVASFRRGESLGLILAEADADTEDMEEEEKWKQAIDGADPGEVFIQGIVPGGQADIMGIFSVGDRLQGVGELPLSKGGFERAVELIQDQPRKAKYVALHFDRKPGLVGETKLQLSVPNILPALAGQIKVLDQGAWTTKGRRSSQEDTFILHEVHDTKDRSILLAGVLDGHLGDAASKFVQNELPTRYHVELLSNPDAPVGELLQLSWEKVCNAYRELCMIGVDCEAEYDPVEGKLNANTASAGALAGTTASIFAVGTQSGMIAALNCGDSRGIIINADDKLLFQTVDHKPDTEYERFEEGQKQGLDYSLPQCRFSTWRVAVGDYDYAVARSLEGPFATSKGIISTPDISDVPAEPGMILFVATDGFWEVIDSEEASRIITKLKSQNMSSGDVAKALCSMAVQKGSSDNVSGVVLFL